VINEDGVFLSKMIVSNDLRSLDLIIAFTVILVNRNNEVLIELRMLELLMASFSRNMFKAKGFKQKKYLRIFQGFWTFKELLKQLLFLGHT